MRNQEHIEYTYKHRKIVMYLANKYVKEGAVLKQIQDHDMDKLFMYLFYNNKDVSALHRQLSSHHENEIEKNKADYIEMVLDWESARYTKEDKPLNAYDTLYKYYPELEKQILPILKEWGIAHSNMPKDKEVEEYAKKIKQNAKKCNGLDSEKNLCGKC